MLISGDTVEDLNLEASSTGNATEEQGA